MYPLGDIGNSQELNWVLRAIEPREYDRLADAFEPVMLDAGQVLYEPQHPIQHLYFPEQGVISAVHPLGGDGGVEIGIVGREGFTGLPALFGIDRSPERWAVEVPGRARRIGLADFTAAIASGSSLAAVGQRYAYAFLAQVSQTAACRARHTVEQQCARWLLAVRDRLDGDEFPLKHELLADMLGVRRASVTVVLGTFRESGVIRYRRGSMTILDRTGLAAVACECYRASARELERSLGAESRPLRREAAIVAPQTSLSAVASVPIAPRADEAPRAMRVPPARRAERQRLAAAELLAHAEALVAVARDLMHDLDAERRESAAEISGMSVGTMLGEADGPPAFTGPR
jgi:CRP-like cAMP-binding protein